MSEKDGGSAFPVFGDGRAAEHMASELHVGMSLRDYFAIHADLTDTKFATAEDAAKFLGEPPPDIDDFVALAHFGARVVSKLRYIIADAMLKARES